MAGRSEDDPMGLTPELVRLLAAAMIAPIMLYFVIWVAFGWWVWKHPTMAAQQKVRVRTWARRLTIARYIFAGVMVMLVAVTYASGYQALAWTLNAGFIFFGLMLYWVDKVLRQLVISTKDESITYAFAPGPWDKP
jgi:uncharacterized membrane protein